MPEVRVCQCPLCQQDIDHHAQPSGIGSTHEDRTRARRGVLLLIGAVALFAALCSGLLLLMSPIGSQRPMCPKAPQGPDDSQLTEITLVHTNDTWGYVEPCG